MFENNQLNNILGVAAGDRELKIGIEDDDKLSLLLWLFLVFFLSNLLAGIILKQF